jgi:hypothetical protein
MQCYTVYFIWKLLYMFRVVLLPIIRSANICIYSIWYLSNWQIPDAVDTVACAPDDGWEYHLKHVEQFPDIINRVMLRLVGYILEYFYDAWTPVNVKSKELPLHIRSQGLQTATRYLERGVIMLRNDTLFIRKA